MQEFIKNQYKHNATINSTTHYTTLHNKNSLKSTNIVLVYLFDRGTLDPFLEFLFFLLHYHYSIIFHLS